MAEGVDACDAELIAAAQRGERHAIEVFVRRHDGWVRHVVYATLGSTAAVDDVVQHVWANVWRQLGTLVDASRWRSWLYAIARNAAIDAGIKAGRERRHRAAYEAASGRVAARGPDPAQSLVREEEHRRVLDAIRGLPGLYREPFVLRHVEGWSYAQIAEAMALPVDTVETRLVRARRLLRSALEDVIRGKEKRR